MAQPTVTDICRLSFSLDGSPWCRVLAKPSINLGTLSYSLDGSPWATACISSPGSSILAYFGATPITKIYHGTTQITALHLASP